MANEAGTVGWIVQKWFGQAFPGSPAFQEIVGRCDSICVNVERFMDLSDVGKPQHGVVKRLLIQQFPPDNHCQASAQPKLERASENETPAIEPAASELPNKGRKNAVRVREAIQGVVHETAQRVRIFGEKESRKEHPPQTKATIAN
jgi:hypothetical protein